MVFLLGVQTFPLLEEDKGCTGTEGDCKNNKTCHKTEDAIHDDEAEDGSTDGTGGPGDVTSLESHELKWPLKSLEHGITNVLTVICFC